MKSVTIGGVDYLPASQLAKQLKYTSDYIGQLCRAKKVDAQLVGRSWYVNPESLAEHKKNRYNKAEVPVEGKDDSETAVKITRVEVTAPVTKNIVKMAVSTPDSNFARHMDWKPLKYESDESDLLPQFNQLTKSRNIHIDLAESTDIAIKLVSKSTKLVAEPLPEIPLKGKLKVSSLDTASEVDEVETGSNNIPLPPIPKVSPRRDVGALHHSLPKTSSLVPMSPIEKAQRPVSSIKSVKNEAKLFVPASVLQSSEEEVSFEYVRFTLLTTATVSLVCLFLLFFSESYVAATAGSYQWGIDFSTKSFTALLALFPH